MNVSTVAWWKELAELRAERVRELEDRIWWLEASHRRDLDRIAGMLAGEANVDITLTDEDREDEARRAEMIDCPVCDNDTLPYCRYCNGEGRVTDEREQEIRQAYRDVNNRWPDGLHDFPGGRR